MSLVNQLSRVKKPRELNSSKTRKKIDKEIKNYFYKTRERYFFRQ